VFSKDTEENVATRRRSANGWGVRLAALLINLAFAFALGIAAIQVAAIFSDGIDDDAAGPLIWASNHGTEDFSKRKTLILRAEHLIGSRSVGHLSAVARAPRLTPREQHPQPLRLLPSAERRASTSASIDPD
jgi:hypothetical protein